MSLGASHALDASVLVLNKFYMAVHVISVRRAFCLLFKDLAEVITLDDGRYLAFSSTRAHNSRIYIMMVSNRKIISALTEGNGNDSCPAWSGWLGE